MCLRSHYLFGCDFYCFVILKSLLSSNNLSICSFYIISHFPLAFIIPLDFFFSCLYLHMACSLAHCFFFCFGGSAVDASHVQLNFCFTWIISVSSQISISFLNTAVLKYSSEYFSFEFLNDRFIVPYFVFLGEITFSWGS